MPPGKARTHASAVRGTGTRRHTAGSPQRPGREPRPRKLGEGPDIDKHTWSPRQIPAVRFASIPALGAAPPVPGTRGRYTHRAKKRQHSRQHSGALRRCRAVRGSRLHAARKAPGRPCLSPAPRTNAELPGTPVHKKRASLPAFSRHYLNFRLRAASDFFLRRTEGFS